MRELGASENSPLRYPGSKSRRAVRLLRLADQSRKHYVEPFSGGMGMLFHARRNRAFRTYTANDSNPHLYNFWKVLQAHSERLIDHLWKYYNRNGFGGIELFSQSKKLLNSDNEIVRAAAFFTVARLSIRGDSTSLLLRGRKGVLTISSNVIERLRLYSDLLQGVNLTNLDYRDVDVPRNSFVFLDPPYTNNKKHSFSYVNGIDCTEFRDWADALKCSWLITIDDTNTTNKLFGHYDRVVYEFNRLFPVAMLTQFDQLERRYGSDILVMNYRRPTRDAFVRQFGWSLRKAKRHHTNAADNDAA